MFLSVIAIAVSVQAQAWDVSGVVVDEKGAPLAGAQISRYFLFDGMKLHPYTVEALTTNKRGEFSGRITPYQLPMTYIAIDKDQKLGACINITQESVKSQMKVTLSPLGKVDYKVEIEDGYQPTNLSRSIGVPDTGTVVLLSAQDGPIPVPAGKYTLSFFSIELKQKSVHFEVEPGGTAQAGQVLIELTPISRNIGKPAMPIEFAEARGVPADFKLEDLKGKWVLMEFWGYW